MSSHDTMLSPKERMEIVRRKREIKKSKNENKIETLDELKRELGLFV